MYQQTYRILSSDVDAARRLRLSRLFTFLQELSIAHTTELGMGREKTLDKGLLWIVTMQRVKVSRLPIYDEEVRLLSWPGDTMHLFFPRYYRLEDRAGNALAEGSALWALMDQGTRRIVFPEDHGVAIQGERTGREAPLPVAPRVPAGGEKELFPVPYSYVDLNGHMNNTRYFDLAEDRMPPALRSEKLLEIQAEYSGEARLGSEIELTCLAQEKVFWLSGDGPKKLFRLQIQYQ